MLWKISEAFQLMKWSSFRWVVYILYLLMECEAIRLTNMTSPIIQDPREDMELFCEFDMGTEELYAVKWYKDDHEFFRYIPGYKPSLVQFFVPGVSVDLRKTHCTKNSCKLTLNNLHRRNSSGAYRCEVSSEAPLFRLASQTNNVTVAILVKENPVIEGIYDRYIVGDLVVATCSSGFGDPKPVLGWYINGQQVSNKSVKEIPQRPGAAPFHTDDRYKLINSTIQLRFPLDRKILSGKLAMEMEIACILSVDSVSAAVAPPRKTSKTIQVTSENQINNQKLYGMFGGGARCLDLTMGIVNVFTLISILLCY